jgi:hypothetical protein
MKVPEAVFTPWAQLLCIPCNNAIDHVARHHIELCEVDAEPANVRCDRCNQPAFCDLEDVVLCQRVVDAAQTIGGDDGSAIELWQTGGMCVAAGYRNGRYEMLVTDSEDHPEESHVALLGVYELDEDECPGDMIYTAQGAVWDVAAKARLWEHWIDERAHA